MKVEELNGIAVGDDVMINNVRMASYGKIGKVIEIKKDEGAINGLFKISSYADYGAPYLVTGEEIMLFKKSKPKDILEELSTDDLPPSGTDRPFAYINLADISADAIRLMHSGLARKFFLSCSVDDLPYIFELDELSIIITKHLIEKSFKLREVGELK